MSRGISTSVANRLLGITPRAIFSRCASRVTDQFAPRPGQLPAKMLPAALIVSAVAVTGSVGFVRLTVVAIARKMTWNAVPVVAGSLRMNSSSEPLLTGFCGRRPDRRFRYRKTTARGADGRPVLTEGRDHLPLRVDQKCATENLTRLKSAHLDSKRGKASNAGRTGMWPRQGAYCEDTIVARLGQTCDTQVAE